jgi:hypothetical protein
VVHVISRPRATWSGERGRINASLLDRHLPADLRGVEFFICAKPVMHLAHRSYVGLIPF